MDMPTIRIDQDVWTFLQSKAKPFEDSPNDVLRRELGLDRSAQSRRIEGTPSQGTSARPHGGSLLLADRDYTHHSVKGYELGGKHHPANSFKDVLVGLSDHLRREHLQFFDKAALGLHGKKRPYFSLDPKDLRHPHRVLNSNLFVETNLNANLIVAICLTLIEALGHEVSGFSIS